MGEIIVKIPSRTNRQYVVTDKADAERLLEAIDAIAVQVKSNPASREDLDYAEDVRDIRAALSELRRTGKTHKWSDAKADLGL